jgi:hypothetical protein
MTTLFAFVLKTKPFELLKDKNELTYSVKYKNEEYSYLVKVARDKAVVSFDYSISGGTKILTGVFKTTANKDLNYKTPSLSIPGSDEGEFEPYMLINKENADRLSSLKWGDSTALVINQKKYQVVAGGDDSFGFSTGGEEYDAYAYAKYFSFTDGGKTGTLVMGTGSLNKQVILELTLPESFELRLSKVVSQVKGK